jgi:hypothetical protein
MPNYKCAKIYKIINDIDDEIYIGSTTQTLDNRFKGHLKSVECNNKGKLYDLIRKYGVEHFSIELLINYPCNSVEELCKKEGEFIKIYGSLNRIVSGRTKKEYLIDNKKIITENKKIYYEKNKELILKKMSEYRDLNREIIRERDRIYYNKNKEFIYEKKKEYNKKRKSIIYECSCGSTCKIRYKPLHEKSKKHLKWLESNQ